MTIQEVIDAVDTLKPNQYSTREKVQWLSFIDERIINDVLKTHEGYDEAYDEFNGYSEDDLTVSLIVESPYDRLYPAFVSMKIDECNGDTQKYNNSYILYNNYLLEYRRYYNKTHMPLPVGLKKASCPVKPADKLSDAEIEAIKRDLYFQLSQEGVGDLVTFGDLTPEQIEMLKGDPFTYEDFTEEQLASLKGDKGDKGDPASPEDLADFVKKTDLATAGGEAGLVKVDKDGVYGLAFKNGFLTLLGASTAAIDNKVNDSGGSNNMAITPRNLDYAVLKALTTNKLSMTDTEKASALAWIGTNRIEIRVHEGADTSGEDAPCVLIFDAAPKALIMLAQVGKGSNDDNIVCRPISHNSYHAYDSIICEKMPTTYTKGWGFYAPPIGSTYQTPYGKKSADGKTISWYVTSGPYSAGEQCNKLGFEYYILVVY